MTSENAHGRTCKKTKVSIYLYISPYENVFENGCIYKHKRIFEFKVTSTVRFEWDLVHLDPPYLAKFLFISIAFKSKCTEKSIKIGKSWPQLKT